MPEGFSPEFKRIPNVVSKIIRFNLVILFLVVVVAIAFTIYMLFSLKRTPVFFPLNDSYAEYRITHHITKYANNFWVLYRKSGGDTIEVLVGTSAVDLKPYVGERVHITGDWAETRWAVVINIKKITKAE
jgi:hypothetical protein